MLFGRSRILNGINEALAKGMTRVCIDSWTASSFAS